MENKKIQIPTEGCMIVGCNRSMNNGSRGLCVNHRAIAGEKVKNGKATWEELESKGLARRKFNKEEYGNRRRHPQNMKRYSSQFNNLNQ